MIRFQGGHQESLEGRIIIRGNPAVDKNKRLLSDPGFFRRKIDRGGGAGPHQLPERQVEVAVGPLTLVVLGERIVRQRPGGVGAGVAQHHQQQRAELLAAQQGILAVDFLQLVAQLAVGVGVAKHHAQPLEEADLVKHRLAVGKIKLANLRHRHAHRQSGGDDRAGAGAGEEIEKIRQHKILLSTKLLPQGGFQPHQDLQRQNTANPSAVQGEDFFRAGRGYPFLQMHHDSSS